MAGYSSESGKRGRDAHHHAGPREGFHLSLALVATSLGIALSAGVSGASARIEVPSNQQTDVCGPISANETWAAAQSPVHVTCDAQLLPSVTLNIEPGVEVRFTTDAPATDFDGIARPQGGGVDIGAYEQGLWRTHLPITLRQ